MKTKNLLSAAVVFAFILTGCVNTTDALRSGQGAKEDIIVIRPENRLPVGATNGQGTTFGDGKHDIIVIRPE